jgi:uncharacterized membrane-anchored protein YhcB (DUF1043 family)
VDTIWWILTGLAIGAIVGGGLVWLLVSRPEGDASVKQLKKENAKFREEVNDHFVQTAELINQLTDSYKAVFDHLSDGAGKLVEEKAVRERMPRVTGQEVRLKHIGSASEDSKS